ncbi:MAG: HAD-IIIC family phosphatase [Lachnospiraceae bacterium]|nr:HAD-IIIC family phosphatase [Lachnospiraceae bacterium]
MKPRIAVLSNVNMNYMIRLLKKEYEVYDSEGYGNELGTMMNPASSYHSFEPQITFLIMDLMEVLEHELEPSAGVSSIERWFGMLESCLDSRCLYYISDACLWGPELEVVWDPDRKRALEAVWQETLKELSKKYSNVFILPYRQTIEKLGEENAFSLKMWYLGRILHTNEAQKRLASLIGDKASLQSRIPKKVLALDLDNTLWGGLAGEAEHTPIALSEDHGGLAYKNLQRVILQMQKQGVLLVIVSKNNEKDAMDILEKHPHCVLRPQCFAAHRINWNPKHENILELARELNLGTDSFVFWDDNPTERELIKTMLPEVAVPDFPQKPEELAQAMIAIYREYFEKASVTQEDLVKTESYAANARRSRLQGQAADFEDYLKQLEIQIIREDPLANVERLTQLVNKTNQFNLTTIRYDQSQMQEILQNESKKVFLYRVTDCFGDNGIVAAAIVALDGIPAIEELVMSCRVMGKNIEYAIVEDMEDQLREVGYTGLAAKYIPTAKNKPVELFYEKLGYEIVSQTDEGVKNYAIDLAKRPKRVYYAKIG